MSPPRHSRLTPEEETFLQAMLWEEAHLVKGQATRAAEEHGLVLIRALEPANRLSPNLHGEALNRVTAGACPPARWPWPGKRGDEVLGLLWARLAQSERHQHPTGSPP
jgi:hypothetical protein